MKTKKQKTLQVPTAAYGVDCDREFKRLFVNCLDGIYSLDIESGDHEKLGQHESYGSGCRLINNDETLITSGYDGQIKWFDVKDKKEIRTVKAHNFWSWNMAVSPDQTKIATVSGQYLAGSYKYDPAKSSEPTVKIIDAKTGDTIFKLEHLPPVQAVAISPDSQHVAAGNLMGEVKVWNLESGKLVAEFKSDDFTSWGIIKSHCYIGGIYAMTFDNSGDQVLIAGMGHMRDPMAGNGKQRWQAFRWKEKPQKVKNSKDNQCGEGLMEALTVRPESDHVVMGGRLRGGKWNLGIFDYEKSELVDSFKTDDRITEAKFARDGKVLMLSAAKNQPSPKRKNKSNLSFGRVHLYDVEV